MKTSFIVTTILHHDPYRRRILPGISFSANLAKSKSISIPSKFILITGTNASSTARKSFTCTKKKSIVVDLPNKQTRDLNIPKMYLFSVETIKLILMKLGREIHLTESLREVFLIFCLKALTAESGGYRVSTRPKLSDKS